MAERIVVEIDAPLYADEGQSLADAVVAAAARQIVQRTAAGRELDNEASRIAQELLRDALAPQVEHALSAMFQPTDSFGMAKGQPKTWGEAIQKEIEKQLKLPSGGRYANDRSTLEKFITEEIERQLRSELRETLEAARTQVLAAVEAEGAKLIRDAIQKAVA